MSVVGNAIYPKKLEVGDHVRVISPARSLGIISASVREIALNRLQEMGLEVSFSKHSEERDCFDSSSVQSRLEDIHEAFTDKKIKAILTTIGGYNSIHLLKHLDYELIRNNPKILCGYSDITTLQHAIFAKTRLVTYSGPHFSTFGCAKGIEYVIDYFQKCLFGNNGELEIFPSATWSDDEWYHDQNKRKFIPNFGYSVIQAGQASGTLIGGNMDSFTTLFGTGYFPSFENVILFLEDNYPMTVEIFDRYLNSIILQKGFRGVQGIVIGRFQVESKIRMDQLKKAINSIKELKEIPVIAGADFGHTLPLFTFPIGGVVMLDVQPEKVSLKLIKK